MGASTADGARADSGSRGSEQAPPSDRRSFDRLSSEGVRLADASHLEAAPPPVCGNSKVEAGEICDDGNKIDGDGCSHSCTEEPGKRCVYEPSQCLPAGTCWGWNDPAQGLDGWTAITGAAMVQTPSGQSGQGVEVTTNKQPCSMPSPNPPAPIDVWFLVLERDGAHGFSDTDALSLCVDVWTASKVLPITMSLGGCPPSASIYLEWATPAGNTVYSGRSCSTSGTTTLAGGWTRLKLTCSQKGNVVGTGSPKLRLDLAWSTDPGLVRLDNIAPCS